MRFIDISNLELPEGWARKANTASSEVEISSNKSKYMDDNSDIWKDLKLNLAKLSFDKCWYCESKEIRSDNPVDHFRPKGNVKESTHEGYWWLAFKYLNYRYSCTFCNSRRIDKEAGNTGGKGEYFPLLDESKRAMNKEGDIDLEHPLLLDPVKPEDPGILWFQEDGGVIPKYSEQERCNSYKRAKTSIELYHLDHTTLKDIRKNLANDIKELIKRGERFFKRLDEPNSDANESFGNVVKDLKDMIKEQSEFSAFSIAILKGRRDISWIDHVI